VSNGVNHAGVSSPGAVWDGARLALVDDLLAPAPAPGEVTVRMLASGICHSDLNVMDGIAPAPLPIVLGHEGAGVVEVLGDGVGGLAVGDPVVIGTSVPCGDCRACREGRRGQCVRAFAPVAPPLAWRGEPVRLYANCGSWAGAVTVRADQLVDVRGIAPESAALLGCAVSTGYGVVTNVAEVRAGDTVVVYGIGGIGVNAIQSARLAGAARVVAVDVDAAKDRVATRFGADAFVVAPRVDRADAIVELVAAEAGAPVDVAVECSGAPVAIDAAIRGIGPGGRVVLVGIPPRGTEVAFAVNDLFLDRRIVGSYNGNVEIATELPVLVDHVRHGRLELDEQVSHVWPLAEIEDALAAVRAGHVVRAVLRH
jgi:S-(hydroxymethyl)glutathione dehydrogenase/alcohol dehydrogenase